MGKRGGPRKTTDQTPGTKNPISLREEASGKKQEKRGGGGRSNNVKDLLKLDHLQKLALWSSAEYSIPSLAAFYGTRLAATSEVLGVSPDPSLLSCQRCETILRPGFNCTVRIERNRPKAKLRHKKPHTSTQNNVVYKCHFCLYWNLKRGTPKGYLKKICLRKAKPPSSTPALKSLPQEPTSTGKSIEGNKESNKEDEMGSSIVFASDSPVIDSPATPLARTVGALLDGKRRKRNKSISTKHVELESGSMSTDGDKTAGRTRKRRKSWTSLKEIVESSEHDSKRMVANLAIPFVL